MSAGAFLGLAEEPDDEFDGITELEKIAPDRVDGVRNPASGLPILLIKSLGNPTGGAAMTATATETDTIETEEAASPGTEAAKDAVQDSAAKTGSPPPPDDDDDDDDPDGDGDNSADASTTSASPAEKATEPSAEAIQAARGAYETARREHEAAEPTTKGALDATDLLRARTQWNQWNAFAKDEGLDGTREGQARWVTKHVLASAPAELDAEVIKAETAVYKRDIDTATRRRLASEGKALDDGSYPIETKGDLDNAAHLAATGHGNVAGAKRLIARRAKELGVSNPLSGTDGGAASKAGEPAVAETTEAAPAPAEALEEFHATLGKAMGAGLISEKALAEILAQIPGAAKADRPVPARPAGAHREPDGNTTVEQLEPQAGLPTDHDTTGDKTAPSVDAAGTIPPANAGTDVMAVGKTAPYAVKRMHDALCCAYDDTDVVAAYPALKSTLDALDASWFLTEAAAKQAAGKVRKADRLAALAKAASDLKTADPAAIADARAGLRKAFTDAYPSAKIRPSDRIAPGSYTRPYLSAGHSAQHSGGGGANVPPGTHTPEPQDHQRGYLSAGHAAPSPADHGPNNPHPPGSSGHEYYSTAEQDMAGAAMRSIHDHIASTFAGCCPMAPARDVLPDGMGATSAPSAHKPPADMGGVATVKTAGDGEATAEQITAALAAFTKAMNAPAPDEQKGGKGLSKKDLVAALKEASESGARAALAAMKDTDSGTAVQTLVAEQVKALADRYDSRIDGLTKQVEDLGAQPDPAQAPVRGQTSRPEPEGATPVEKRSLIDEARQAQSARAAAERAEFTAYMRMQAESSDPKVRSRAEEVLRGIPGP